MAGNATFHIIWRETDRYLDDLLNAVREGKCIEEAARYSRWLQFSGVITLLEDNKSAFPLVVDGAALRRKANDVVDAVRPYLQGRKVEPKYEATAIAQILSRLESIENQFSPPAQETDVMGTPVLRVIQGGVSSGHGRGVGGDHFDREAGEMTPP